MEKASEKKEVWLEGADCNASPTRRPPGCLSLHREPRGTHNVPMNTGHDNQPSGAAHARGEIHDGFILQAGYRIEAGRAVVHCHGVLNTGATFVLRDTRVQPHFFIAKRDLPVAIRQTQLRCAPTPMCGLRGEVLVRVDVDTPTDATTARDRLHAVGVGTFEADVRLAQQFLIERGVKGACRISGAAARGTSGQWTFDNALVTPGEFVPTLRVLSFDIETDPKAERLLAISLHGCGGDEVLVLEPAGFTSPADCTPCRDEGEIIRRFCALVRLLDPDVLTGWNVIDFDLTVLARIAQRCKEPFELGRVPGVTRLRKAEGFWGRSEANVPGRLVLDGIAQLHGAFIRMDSYALDAVARSVLGVGKTIHGTDRAAEIERRFREDRPAFVEYARTDARLVSEILEKLQLVDLAVRRSRLTGMTPDRVNASIASFDFLYLEQLHRRGRVAPSVGATDLANGGGEARVPQAGGHVLDSCPGLYPNVLVFDFKSLYPSIIRTFNLDPLAFVAPLDGAARGSTDDCIEAPNGARFQREPGILPGMLDELFPRREAAKRTGDANTSQAIKILMNSCYGVLGTPACRFHNPAIANAITSFGKALLLWSKDWFERTGLDVLYGDTDSLFVRSGAADGVAARTLGAQLAPELTAALGKYIEQQWRVQSRLELEFEKVYLRLLLPSVRANSQGVRAKNEGARKRYVGLLMKPHGDPTLEFTGMEVVRRDWTDLAKNVQRELYARLFADREVADYLAQIVREVRAGEHDDLLVYRKGLRKAVADYTENTPPHVAAARKMTEQPGRLIEYLVTISGPEPIGDVHHAIDREHYVDKQIRPVAEPVLALLGLDFAHAIGDARQIELF